MGERHHTIGEDECDRGRFRLSIEPKDELLEGFKEVVHDGVGEGVDVLSRITVRGRKAIGDGFEAEGGKAIEGGGAPRPQQPAVVVLGVDKGDVEASGVEELG